MYIGEQKLYLKQAATAWEVERYRKSYVKKVLLLVVMRPAH